MTIHPDELWDVVFIDDEPQIVTWGIITVPPNQEYL